jgi:CIC family chloride channel protein
MLATLQRIFNRVRRPASESNQEAVWFLTIAGVVGALVGLAAAFLSTTIHWLTEGLHRLSGVIGPGVTYLVPLLVPLGLLAAWWIAQRFSPQAAGGGVPETVQALVVRNGYLATPSIFYKMATTILTLGFGGSAGREGPMVQIGGTIGSSLSRHLGLGEDKVRSLVAAGAGAAIGASFNAPIAGMLFALEVILVSFAVRHMSAVVIASVVAAVTITTLIGSEDTLSASVYELGSPKELLLYAGLAILASIVAVVFIRTYHRTSHTMQDSGWKRPVVFGFAIAGLALVELRLPAAGATSRILGSGEAFVSSLLRLTQSSLVWWAILAIALLKLVASALTHDSGGSGGLFMPTLFVGASLGAAFAQLVGPYWSASALQPGAFALVGMATMFAAVARAPLTAMLIVFELTGARDYGLILPLMLTAAIATFITERFQPDGTYMLELKDRGVNIHRKGEIDLLDTVDVGEVMGRPPLVHQNDTLLSVQERMDSSRSHGFAVVNAKGALCGVITATDVMRSSDKRLFIKGAMTANPITVTPGTHVSDALEKMASLGIGRLPVVSEYNPTECIGMFRREDAITAYHQALGATTDEGTHRTNLKHRTQSGTTHYFDFSIPKGSFAAGKMLRENVWPESSTLVSVSRGVSVIVPQGDTILRPGDVVTAFGTEASRSRIIERLNAGADEPTAEIPFSPAVKAGPTDPAGAAPTDV